MIQILTANAPGNTVNIGAFTAQAGNRINITGNDGIYAMTGTVAVPGTFVTAITAGTGRRDWHRPD